MRVIFLDSGPLGLLANPRGSKPQVIRCVQWARGLEAAGVRLIVPEICDYEVRRKLINIGSTAGLQRLDRLKITLDFIAITSDAMLLAAALWPSPAAGGYRPRRPLRSTAT